MARTSDELLAQLRDTLLVEQALADAAAAGAATDSAAIPASRGDDAGSTDLPPDALATVDLRSLLAEMAALKNEVRLQARQYKTAYESLQAQAEALQGQQQLLQQQHERLQQQAEQARRQDERALLLGLLELRDRLQGGLDASQAWQPTLLARWGGAERFVQTLGQGAALSLQRLDGLLASRRVRAFEVLGQPLDPETMLAQGTEFSPQTPEGLVLRELRRGYTQSGELLRAAEVIVNKKGAGS